MSCPVLDTFLNLNWKEGSSFASFPVLLRPILDTIRRDILGRVSGKLIWAGRVQLDVSTKKIPEPSALNSWQDIRSRHVLHFSQQNFAELNQPEVKKGETVGVSLLGKYISLSTSESVNNCLLYTTQVSTLRRYFTVFNLYFSFFS